MGKSQFVNVISEGHLMSRVFVFFPDEFVNVIFGAYLMSLEKREFSWKYYSLIFSRRKFNFSNVIWTNYLLSKRLPS